jgi:DNA phosphorothioation-associated putative methyltransferase
MTSRGTFQHFYNHSDFGEWIEGHLGVTPIAAAPGTFLVFRKAGQREQYLARKYSVRIPVPHFRKSDKMFLENRDALEPLITFFIRHGRLPKSSELNNAEMITEIFGSIGRAFRVIEVVTDHNEWSGIAERRRIDIYVFLALRLLDGEYRMSDLDESMRTDVRAHHGSFAAALTPAKATPSILLAEVQSLGNSPHLLSTCTLMPCSTCLLYSRFTRAAQSA